VTEVHFTNLLGPAGQFNLDALFSSASAVAGVPLFLLALLLVRGLPALLYREMLNSRKTVVAALLQATSLPFIVAASMIGQRAMPTPATPVASVDDRPLMGQAG
jgi:hypothetical protein